MEGEAYHTEHAYEGAVVISSAIFRAGYAVAYLIGGLLFLAMTWGDVYHLKLHAPPQLPHNIMPED